MSEQWDRENHQDNAVNVMSDQYKWAAIDKLWTRDEGDEMDMGPAGKGDVGVLQEGQVYKYDQELSRMMGALNDDGKQVDMEMTKRPNGEQNGGFVRTKGGGKNHAPSKLKFDTKVFLDGRQDTRTVGVDDKRNNVQIKKKKPNMNFDTKPNSMQETKTNIQTAEIRTKPETARPIKDLKSNEKQLQGKLMPNKKLVEKRGRVGKVGLQQILAKNEPKMPIEDKQSTDKVEVRQKQQALNGQHLDGNFLQGSPQVKSAKVNIFIFFFYFLLGDTLSRNMRLLLVSAQRLCTEKKQQKIAPLSHTSVSSTGACFHLSLLTQ